MNAIVPKDKTKTGIIMCFAVSKRLKPWPGAVRSRMPLMGKTSKVTLNRTIMSSPSQNWGIALPITVRMRMT